MEIPVRENKKTECVQKQTESILLGAILLLALSLRLAPLPDLTRGSLALEEGIAMTEASALHWELVSSVQIDQGPLKSYLLHPLLYLSRDEFLLRLPSLFFDIFSILVLFFLGKALFDRKTALLACFFMAVSVWHIHYATSARNYPLYIFSLLGSALFLYRAVRSSGIRDWIFYAVALAFQFYSFFWGFFFLIAQLGWFFICYGRQGAQVKRLVLSLGLFLILLLPSSGRLVNAFDYKTSQAPWDWGAQCLMIWELLGDHFGGVAGFLPLGIIVFVLSFVGLFYFRDKKRQALFLLMLVVVPILFYVFCQYVLRINIAPRYFLLTHPFFLLLSAAGILSWRRWTARAAGMLVLLLPLFLYGLFQAKVIGKDLLPFDYLRQGEDHAAVASVINEHEESLDFAVIEPPFALLSVQYYLDRTNRSPVIMLSKGPGKERCFIHRGPKVTLVGLEGDFETIKALAGAGRLLVVDFGQIAHEKNREEILAWLEANSYRIERDYREHGEDLYFISPPKGGFAAGQGSSEAALHELFQESRVVRYLTYPFNRHTGD